MRRAWAGEMDMATAGHSLPERAHDGPLLVPAKPSVNKYRRRVKERVLLDHYGGDPWMTKAQRKQLTYEFITTVGRPAEFGTRLHELLEAAREVR